VSENERLKPKLPCGNCSERICEVKIGDGNYALKPCEKYKKFRKEIGEYWDKYGLPKD